MKKIKTPLYVLLILVYSLFGLFNVGAVYAANVTLTKESIALSNSNPGTVTTHTISSTPSDTTDLIKTILLQYATSASNSTAPTGLSMSATPTVTVANNGSSLANSATYSAGLVTITLTTATALSAAGSATVITIANVTNPNAGNFYVQITNETAAPVVEDFGVVETATVASVTVTGTQDPSLTFTVSGVASGTATGTTGAQNTTTATTTATTIPYGHFTTLGTTNAASQLISTTTNAANGYTVTLQENQVLTGPSTISNIAANTTWNNATTAGFGVNVSGGTNPDTNTNASGGFNTNTEYQPIPINATTLTLASKGGVTNAAGDSEYVNFQVGVSAAQAAGNYTNTVNYVVTPTY